MVTIKYNKLDLVLKIIVLGIVAFALTYILIKSFSSYNTYDLIAIILLSMILFFGWLGISYETITVTFEKDYFKFERKFRPPFRIFMKTAQIKAEDIEEVIIKFTFSDAHRDRILVKLKDKSKIKMSITRWHSLDEKSTVRILESLSYKVRSISV